MSAYQCYHVQFALYYSLYLLFLLACVVMPMAGSYCHLPSLSLLSLSALRNSVLNYYGPMPFINCLLSFLGLKKNFSISFHFQTSSFHFILSFPSHMYHFLLFLLSLMLALLVLFLLLHTSYFFRCPS